MEFPKFDFSREQATSNAVSQIDDENHHQHRHLDQQHQHQQQHQGHMQPQHSCASHDSIDAQSLHAEDQLEAQIICGNNDDLLKSKMKGVNADTLQSFNNNTASSMMKYNSRHDSNSNYASSNLQYYEGTANNSNTAPTTKMMSSLLTMDTAAASCQDDEMEDHDSNNNNYSYEHANGGGLEDDVEGQTLFHDSLVHHASSSSHYYSDNQSDMVSSPSRQTVTLNNGYPEQCNDHAPSPLPFAISTNSLMNLDSTDASKDGVISAENYAGYLSNNDPTTYATAPIDQIQNHEMIADLCFDKRSITSSSKSRYNDGSNGMSLKEGGNFLRGSMSMDASSTHNILHLGSATENSYCCNHDVVEGRLADLASGNDDNLGTSHDLEEGGIVILDPSTDEDVAETLHAALRECGSESNDDDVHHPQTNSLYSSSRDGGGGIQITPPAGAELIILPVATTKISVSATTAMVSPSMFENDSIILAAAAHVNANAMLDERKGDMNTIEQKTNVEASLDFEQLMDEAGCSRIDLVAESNDGHSEKNSWNRNEGDSSNAASLKLDLMQDESKGTTSAAQPPTAPPAVTCCSTQPSPTHTTIRATRIRHDKFVVEIDIFGLHHGGNSRLDIRDAIDIMANVDLLHLWFDPIPAVFEAAIKDGSGSNNASSTSLRSSPSSSLSSGGDIGNIMDARQYDGEWIEISTPLLVFPSDSRLYGCLRSIRVGFRSIIGFPARIRSMIFVERQCGRIGVTLGPYPDGWCNGTMAYHTFSVRAVCDEENKTTKNRERIVISDEVRLQRGGDEDLNGVRSNCGYCFILRLFWGLFEWLFLRWYQPDLASFMSQTIASLEKLRSLVERGESMAFAGDELVMDGVDWEEGNANELISAPLLG